MKEAYDGQLQAFNYQELAQRTSAAPTPELFKRLLGHGVSVALSDILSDISLQASLLDQLKKHVFYGKQSELAPNPFDYDEATKKLLVNENRLKIIHGIIGIITEAGELAEVLIGLIDNGEDFDMINVKEESGDIFWYLAEMLTGAGYTFEQSQRTNIAKLAARYGDKFSDQKALNRDLNKERHVLESNEDDHHDAQEN